MCVFCEATKRMADEYAFVFDAQREIEAMTDDPEGRK